MNIDMKKLCIAIVCDSINNFVAGSFISALRFSELLSKKGHTVIIISSKPPNSPALDEHNGMKIYRLHSFPIQNNNKTIYFAYPNSKKINEILKQEKINLLHFMIPTPLSRSAINAAKDLGIKIIAHSHTQPENIEPYFPRIFKKTGINKYLLNLLYKYIVKTYDKADAVICPSKFSEALLKSKNLKSKTYVISNGIDTYKFKRQNAKKYNARFNLSGKTKKILFVGRLDPEKNISVLINAVAYIKKGFNNFEVCIVGDGTSKGYLEKLSKKLTVDDKIRFLGKVSDKDLIRIYNLCDIFVLPSLVELEGMVVLEAMSCGKAVLIADAPNSASRYFVDNNGFLFDPYNENDLAKKAVRLLKDDILLKKMSEQSYRNCKDFDIRKSISKLEKVYAGVLS